MAHKKKTRKISDIMPARKADKTPINTAKIGKRKITRYELDIQARLDKKKKKHKGLASGSRHNVSEQKVTPQQTKKDPRIGSRKKVPLMVEFVNKPEKGEIIPPMKKEMQEKRVLSPEKELAQLENNECLNQLLDDIENGKTLSVEDQKFVNECLDRVDELMTELGIITDDIDDNELLRQFETANLNNFR
ncbi:Der GTPase-activating protein YihI [Phocoenobacter skyensis]|uniref:Der GTPase-activating protein YihI n=1 Tax=Phocoenobacter skyensis TaxID=97481 RepID=A0A1H7WH18_9PAST|nr:Der GTPase-activating protein YihI [Pasteurella skyensis]MDP8079213.1 Der GTPase-activating protein YihI [Pasteurella skyensis]MDP8085177.1 Der GTPase-activating protein YihI [Pasteurella skyensis]MDP8162141.1 Der GTPase-activating protein YihI [Pasteurella skyensis]MDP8170012.1 Der GTPase-activating protein YihI [Pasteurella skyensis]MDP8173000.1 Der GTPase-activating protein YihI [Pasteurella skyensis]